MTAPLSKQQLTYLRAKLVDGLPSIDARVAVRLLDELQESDEALSRLANLLERYERSGAYAKALSSKVSAILEPTSSWKRNQAAHQKPLKASTWGT